MEGSAWAQQRALPTKILASLPYLHITLNRTPCWRDTRNLDDAAVGTRFIERLDRQLSRDKSSSYMLMDNLGLFLPPHTRAPTVKPEFTYTAALPRQTPCEQLI